MNDTLMDQCRREAPYKAQYHHGDGREFWTLEGPGGLNDVSERYDDILKEANRLNKAYAAALYAERSKRPPTVDGPPMITVEAAMDEVKSYIRDYMVSDYDWNDLRARLTAAANNNTNDNEAR